MILLPPLNLFFYNIILGFLDCQYRKTVDGTLPERELTFWHKVPILNAFMDYPEPIFPSPNDILPDLNPYVNALILIPAIFKHKYLKVVLALVIMWNLFICQRIFVYFLRLLATLWVEGFGWPYVLAILAFGLTLSFAHLLLMYYTAKMPLGQVFTWRRNRSGQQ